MSVAILVAAIIMTAIIMTAILVAAIMAMPAAFWPHSVVIAGIGVVLFPTRIVVWRAIWPCGTDRACSHN
jgi:hypothetical protein